ncbi:50S ribosomal protein L30e [Candidatus Bathyarchaeota archaeon]|nr:MAG: 50S ribosomal protein L30e [Candidatus Bathyarchaeota archaeon]RLI18830.1 MAG: 50S ribosomal protein L30e [Candidatus Bathyarchaeota archaeon]
MDIDKAIATAVKTGKVAFGTKSAIHNAKTGRAKLLILASNCPSNVRSDLEYYCKLSNVPIITYRGTSLDLAGICGKPFPISALSIREPGDSEILRLTEKIEGEESSGGSE